MPQSWIMALVGLLIGLSVGWITDKGMNRYLNPKSVDQDFKARIFIASGVKFLIVVILFFLVYRWVPLFLGTGAGIILEKQWFIIQTFRSMKKSKGKEEK